MIRSTGRLAITLGCIAVSVVWISHGIGLIPDASHETINGRLRLCESIALTTTTFAERGHTKGLELILDRMAQRNPDILSVGVRQNERLVVSIGEHERHWNRDRQNSSRQDESSTSTHMKVDILANGRSWGTVEIRFAALPYSGIAGFIRFPMLFIVFSGAMVSLISWAFLSRSLKYLNPSKVVPSRVRLALDSLAEGLILVDPNEQIVLANQSFSAIVGISPEKLLGEDPNQFAWQSSGESSDGKRLPWQTCLVEKAPCLGQMICLTDDCDYNRKFIVNASPIVGPGGQCKGALASFDDVTALEDKRVELSRMLNILRASRDEIRRQNEHLHYLAARDSMTGCFNRRSFFEQFRKMWDSTKIEKLNVIMLDIDHFKSINDDYGHAVGDEAIKRTAKTLLDLIGDAGAVCRYGGEEFCVVMPNIEFQTACEIGEKIRRAIEEDRSLEISLTVSVGVTARHLGAMDIQHLLDQADQCLYAAKNKGRNQVVRWDTCSKEQLHVDADADSNFMTQVEQSSVSALYTALYYRDSITAMHSSRVANLVRTVSARVLDERTVKTVEIAGLLHDIGKIGIPDSILRNPGTLTEKQLEVMNDRHDVSHTIVKSALKSPDVAVILRSYQLPFDKGTGYAELDKSQPRIALACRILAVCDAFDSMIHAAGYRKPKSIHSAINELWQCSPQQFDPQMVALLEIVVDEEPEALKPIKVEGAIVGDESTAQLGDITAAARIGDVGPIRDIVSRLKRVDFESTPEIQNAAERLETSLNQNDDELKKLIEMTQDLVDLCQKTGNVDRLQDISNVFEK